jgi:hypothetical protein
MQALVLIGALVYYGAVAAAFNWFLPRNSLWFTTFLAIVVSQTVLFGGSYLYYGYWDAWWGIALVTSSGMCIATSAVMSLVFYKLRSRAPANAPT